MRDAHPFDPLACESVLPRAYQFLDASAYLNHIELVRRARGAAVPESMRTSPLIYQAVCDGFLAPNAEIPVANAGWGIDMEAEGCVVVDDVPRGVTTESAAAHITLLLLNKNGKAQGGEK